MNAVLIAALLAGAGVLLLLALRFADRRREDAAWRGLIRLAGNGADCFDPAMVDQLPGPARRYFRYTISAGAPLYRAVELGMSGRIGLGTKDKPGYRPMRAEQILAPPYGLVWKLRTGQISGSDGLTPDTSWTRFWLFGLIPVVRAGGNADHHRSAFGRVVAEGAFWAPASLLPGQFVRWEPVDDSTARAVVRCGALEQAVDITVAEDGQPTRVLIQRWSNANADAVFREQPFGGSLSAFQTFQGYRLPTRVEGGNHFGTEAYFPFFQAEVRSIHFPHAGDASGARG